VCRANVAKVATIDPVRAIKGHDSETGSGPESFRFCHGSHHVLGEAAGAALDIETILAANPGTCGYGFIHGAIVGKLGAIPAGRVVVEGVDICVTIEAKTEDELLYNNCLHALGHRIAIDGATFVEIEESCPKMDGDGYESCVAGGYMESFNQVGGPGMVDSLVGTCNSKSGGVAKACWVALMARVAGEVADLGPGKMAETCLEGTEPATCARGVGQAYALFANSEEAGAVRALVDFCTPMREQMERCLVGGIPIIYEASVQGVIPIEEFKTAIETDIPATHQEAVRGSLADIGNTPQP